VPNRATDLVWEDTQPAPPGGLTRAAIVEAAMRIADEDGLEAVSIRRVAAELEARPMSLYTHIASKEDLVALMANEAVAHVVVPEPLPADWREALTAIGRRTRDAFRAHPWVLKALAGQRNFGPNATAHAAQSEAAVAGLGLSRKDAAAVLGMVDDYTLGHCGRIALLQRMGVEDLRPHDYDTGLQTLLDGVEPRFIAGRS
jgi:AcrR family transcriptional regulator